MTTSGDHVRPSRRRRIRWHVAVLGAATLAFPAIGRAVLIPNHAMGDVRLGWSEQRVVRELGDPVTRLVVSDETGETRRLGYRGLTVLLHDGEVALISTSVSRRANRTRTGVGVGTSERRLRARLWAVACSGSAGGRRCTVGTLRPGRSNTVFVMRRGRVTRISVGNVLWARV